MAGKLVRTRVSVISLLYKSWLQPDTLHLALEKLHLIAQIGIPAISLQLCINLQTLIRRYGMEHAMLNLMQAVVPSSNVTSVTTSIMTVKVLNTFPPGTSDQNAMSEDGQQLQLGSSTCCAVKTIQRGHTDCCRSVAVRAQY